MMAWVLLLLGYFYNYPSERSVIYLFINTDRPEILSWVVYCISIIPFRFLIISVELMTNSWIYTNYRLVDLPWNSPWTWFIAFLTIDFLYYWFHRAAHGSFYNFNVWLNLLSRYRYSLYVIIIALSYNYASIRGGGIGIYGMAVLACFSYGISVFSLKNCGITILEILRYTVFAILDSKLRLLTKFACRITVLNTPQCPPL